MPGSCYRKKIAEFFIFPCLMMLFFSRVSEAAELTEKNALSARNKGKKVIAALISHNVGPYWQALEGFKELINEKGLAYEVIVYEGVPAAEGRKDLFAEEVRAIGPDLILAIGTEAATLAAQRIKEIPIVFSMALISNIIPLKELNDNITGASINIPIEDQLKELIAILPNARRIGLICNADYYAKYVENQAKPIAEKAGMNMVSRFVEDESEVFAALEIILPDIDVFLFMPGQAVLSDKSMKVIISETAEKKVPLVAPSPRFVEEGALFALGCDHKDIGRQSAELALEIIAGKKAGEIPMTQVRKPQLYLNLKTARRINLDIPQEVVSRADEVIE